MKKRAYIVWSDDWLTHETFSYEANIKGGGGSRSVMVIAMECRIIVSEFELLLHYHIHVQTNTLGKGMRPLILPDIG